MILVLECLVVCFILFLPCVIASANGAEQGVFLYEKDAQERVVQMGLITKDIQILIKISKSDKEKIRERMNSLGVRNLSAFMRKMAIDGYIINLDLSDVKEVVRLLKINSNNLNQYAKKASLYGTQLGYSCLFPLLSPIKDQNSL